jgi:hypothetical protein
MTPGRKGAIAEAAIAAEAIRLGFDVYRPVSKGGRYASYLHLRSGPTRNRQRSGVK